MAEQLEALASSVASAMGARSATLLVDDQTGRCACSVHERAGCAAERVGRTAQSTRSATPDGENVSQTVALVCEGVLLGEMQVTSAPGRDFTSADLLVLRLLAPRVAAHVERVHLANAERRSRLEAEQARRQVNVLARASVPLAPGLEHPEETIRELADIVVPEFADLFAVDLVRDGGQLERIVVAYSDPGMASSFEELSADRPDWRDTLRRVMTLEESELVFSTAVDQEAPGDDHGALLHALDLQSWVVAPIRVRGAAIGTMTLATSHSRRGYRPSDQVTINDLVAEALSRSSGACSTGRRGRQPAKRR